MAELHKVIANLKTALESGAPKAADAPAPPVPTAPSAHRAELATSVARELEAVGGNFLGILTPAQAVARIVSLANELSIRTVAIGNGAMHDMGAIGEALERNGQTIVRTVPMADDERAAMRTRVANADLGIAEADFAIASTGTLAVTSTAWRPSSLTLLPPASLVLVRIDRVVANLAAMLEALGPDGVAANRLTLITGP
ncbi:MAG TPA: LUD domain-containing protein, partial [Candidatus Acidoferrales bacterium]|nr:LUD domain-containing protein [Candidatus Acidoferrales bacterium]